jgi:hypothetical protein
MKLKVAMIWLLAMCSLVVGIVASAATGNHAAQSPAPGVLGDGRAPDPLERTMRATDRAMEYIASRQQPDGSWQKNHAINGLALLAFMGKGHVPGRGPYRDVLERGKAYILATTDRKSGYVSFGTMYEHGLATLALAEMYGMDSDPLLEERVRKAVELIVRVQSAGGGWNYNPAKGDGDLSVSVMQIVALRSAMNAEVPVPAETNERSIAYLRAHTNENGGFGYTGPGRSPQTTAAGILSMQLLGKHDDPSVGKSLALLQDVPIRWGGRGDPAYFYYFHYYAIQAFYQAGGRSWSDWHPRIRDLLLQMQNSDGSWDNPPNTLEQERIVGSDKVYWTAMASLVLDIYLHFLPAYQR